MIVVTTVQQQFNTANVPLRCEYLRQASLFDERDYPLPTVMPGKVAVIFDADDWTLNFKRGTVTAYSYFSGLHTIYFDSMAEGNFKLKVRSFSGGF
jgi:hypothetical protein